MISVTFTDLFSSNILWIFLLFSKSVLSLRADWKVAGCQKDFNVSRQHVTTPFSMDYVPCRGLNLLLNGES